MCIVCFTQVFMDLICLRYFSPTCHIFFLHFTHELMINFEQDNHETHNCVHSMNRESHTVCGCLDSRTVMIICQICFSRGNNSVVFSPIVIQCTPMENLQLTVWEWKAKSQSVIGKMLVIQC